MKYQQFHPAEPELWNIMNAGHIGFSKVLEDLADNAFAAGAAKILIQLRRESAESLCLTIHDTGIGISEQELSHAFGVGHIALSKQAGPHNQYGIGLKAALANCDPSNCSWTLYSCAEVGDCVQVYAPYYPEEMDYATMPREQMPGPDGWPVGQGTCVATPASNTLFCTCAPKAMNDTEQIAALVEGLRVTYTPLLEGRDVKLEWTPLGGAKETYALTPLLPDWVGNVVEQEETVDFGAGKLIARYRFGAIDPRKDAIRHFKGNMTSSGLAIYLRGRLIQNNIFKEVWSQPHPSYNNFLFIVDLHPVDEEHRGCAARPQARKGPDDSRRSPFFRSHQVGAEVVSRS